MKYKLELILLSVFSLPVHSFAQPWSGIIDPTRAIDWSNAGVPGGIPKRTTTCATLSPGVTSGQINTAIAGCPANQVVFLNPGTYTLSSGIDFGNHSNVTLRGAGADQTFLIFTGNVNCRGVSAAICIDNGDTNYPGGASNAANWTAGYAPGSAQITLSSTANLVAGQSLITLDQLDDTNTDTGNIWVCQTTNVCSNGGPSGSGRPGRAQGQLVLVTAIAGSTVTISPGPYMPNWRSGQAPGAWWANTIVTGDGVENLSMDHSSSGAQSGVFIVNAFQCWVAGVRSLNADWNYILLYLASHSVVRDSYFYVTQNSDFQSYGTEVYMSSDNLIENNIFQKVAAPMLMNGSGSGTVFGHNYAINDYYTVSPTWMAAANFMHSAGTDMVLLEGNQNPGMTADNVHGTHYFITAFRNQFIGWETGKTKQTIPVHLYTGSRYFNIIGNVLGKQGYHTQYEDRTPTGINGDLSIYTLGWSGNEGGTDTCCVNDPLVASTLLRWGNVDVVTGAPQFRASEVPTSLSRYANALPSSTNLPASFYLNSRPPWWGSTPWPAIGPDVTGGVDSTGHVYLNPAQKCYAGATKDASGVATFNASACYATHPVPPTSLSTISN
jgi:hypothetical protein